MSLHKWVQFKMRSYLHKLSSNLCQLQSIFLHRLKYKRKFLQFMHKMKSSFKQNKSQNHKLSPYHISMLNSWYLRKLSTVQLKQLLIKNISNYNPSKNKSKFLLSHLSLLKKLLQFKINQIIFRLKLCHKINQSLQDKLYLHKLLSKEIKLVFHTLSHKTLILNPET